MMFEISLTIISRSQLFKMFTRLIINCVEKNVSCEDIANVFWSQQIAKIDNVTLTLSKSKQDYCVAHIDIQEWCDTEVAYNFIKKMKDGKEPRIVHNDDDWWPVKPVDTPDDLVSLLF